MVVSKQAGVAQIKLASNAIVSAGYPESFDPDGKVTIVVRPEHADLVPDPAKGTVAGTLSNVVYFGTDTNYHVELDGGGAFIVRHQNSRLAGSAYESGAKVGILFEDDGARVLRD
jgi:spermidine/putrescine transport system ATP-binding protein